MVRLLWLTGSDARYLAKEDFSDDSLKYFADNNIQVFHHRLTGNKEPFSEIGEEDIAQALNTVLGATRIAHFV